MKYRTINNVHYLKDGRSQVLRQANRGRRSFSQVIMYVDSNLPLKAHNLLYCSEQHHLLLMERAAELTVYVMKLKQGKPLVSKLHA